MWKKTKSRSQPDAPGGAAAADAGDESPPAPAPAEHASSGEGGDGAAAAPGADSAPGPKAEAGAEPATEVSAEERVPQLERELEAARAEVAAAADRALRSLAEFDNYRRRTERDREDSVRRGRAEVLRELLEVVDNFDRALAADLQGVPAPFLDGMRLVARGLHDLLDRRGVARIDAEGQRFDPELHEALTAIPRPGVEPDTVVQVVQAGYRFEDRVLRPAKVIVSAALPAEGAAAARDDLADEPAEGA